MAFKIRSKKLNINRVVAKVAQVIIALYVGGTIVSELGNVMNCTASPFNTGLTLIGWTVGSNTPFTSGICNATADPNVGSKIARAGTITAVGGTGILSVIGIVGIASLVTEFVSFRM